MVLVISAFGLLLWIAFLLVAFVLTGTIWLLCNLVLWLMDLKPRLTRRKPAASPKRNGPRIPEKANPDARAASDIWPKWTASHRQSKDRELASWQDQFDALDSRRHG